jgi:glycosyltransferase involved in cell wall biosynthesis
MNVAIIVARIDMLGPVIVIQNLVNGLSVFNDLNIKVIYIDKKVNPNVKMNVPAERFDSRTFRFADYDIIHTNGIRPDLLAFFNRRKIKYHISTIHNFVFEDLSSAYNGLISLFFGNIWLRIWKRADKLVCVSEAMKNYYLRWYKITKLEVVHNGITETDSQIIPDEDIIASIELFHSRGLKVLGTAAILTKRKGIDQILNLISVEKGFALIIIGEGKELPDLQRLATTLKISDRCLFFGFRNNAKVYFRYFDFFIMPSRSEGFGLALIEAVQQKVPVICSDIDVFRELFASNEVTFFKLGDLNSLSNSMKTAIETGFTKTKTAYERFQSNYTALIMAKHYQSLYKS